MNLSFEFFPPRTDIGREKLIQVQKDLSIITPEYYSVTFGAGGSTQNATLETVQQISTTNILATPHISCIGSKKSEILLLLNKYKDLKIKRIVVLRGDIPSGVREIGDFNYADELVGFIRHHFNDNFKLTVAAYPEKHPQAKNYNQDFEHFINKLSLADNAITQYFYNIDAFLYFCDGVAKYTNKTIIPGIMPITNYENLIRFSNTCGADIPRWIKQKLSGFTNISDLQKFGFEVVNDLCQNLKKHGVNDFHFYTMNKSEPSLSLAQNLLS